jgi:hypothetical protein
MSETKEKTIIKEATEQRFSEEDMILYAEYVTSTIFDSSCNKLLNPKEWVDNGKPKQRLSIRITYT